VPCNDVASVGGALREIVTLASPVAPRSRVSVVLSPAWVQVKQLCGLPSMKSPKLANQLLRENQQSFFMWTGAPRLVADIHIAKDGTCWGAAYDADVVAAVVAALRYKRKPIAKLGSGLVAIAASTPGALSWTDGVDAFQLDGDASGLRRAERVEVGAARVDPPRVPERLAALGEAVERFTDAHAAALAPRRRLSLMLRVEPSRDRERARSFAHRTIAAGLAASAALFAGAGPGFRATRVEQSMNLELGAHRQAGLEIARDEAELKRATQTLDRLEEFRRERGQMTRILGALSQAIPESTAMLSFHVDSAEGGFTAIAPHAADILPELAVENLIVSPRIVGSVTRETIGGVQLERAAFRFARPRAAGRTGSRK
jgi:hypothetical protein